MQKVSRNQREVDVEVFIKFVNNINSISKYGVCVCPGRARTHCITVYVRTACNYIKLQVVCERFFVF